MNRRTQEVLHSIVREYIETGEPVSSRSVSKARSDGLSPASVRNAMADLEETGYLMQPHTSAGRIPTAKAFRTYVRSLSAGRMTTADAERMRAEMRGLPTVEERVARSSHLLTELTRNVGIAAALPCLDQALDQIELIHLGDRRVLTILVTQDRMVRDRVVVLEEQVTQDELHSIRNYVNQNFRGWRLSDVRRDLLQRIAEESAAYDALLSKLSLLYQKGLLAADTAPEIHMEGASNLVGLDLHLTRERMRDLMRALEEKQRLKELLDCFLEGPAGELAVCVGLEEAHPAMRELVLIGMSVILPGGFAAKIAVLGPMRMRYERTMAAVLTLGMAFQSAPL